MKSKLTPGLLLAVLLGIVLAINGIHLMGYVAAIAIPKEFFEWFSSSNTAMLGVNLVTQFLGFGIFALMIGVVLGKVSKRFALNCIVCYAVFIFCMSVGAAVVYNESVVWPFYGLLFGGLHLITDFVVPICLFAAALYGARE